MNGNEDESGVRRAAPRRAGRPRRLTVEEIVGEAIELADDQGLDGLSMPKLADRLGVGTMTLYTYVSSKEDLLDRIAERMLQGLNITVEPTWQDAMFEFFAAFRAAALAHPSLARLLAGGRITIPAVFDILEGFFGRMTEEGVPVETAVRTFYAALTYTIGFVLWEIPRTHDQSESDYAAQWAELLGRLDSDQYPILTGAVGGVAPTVASRDQFDWGLSRILTA